MHTITSPHGTVNRIVIFRKSGVQAMVEYLFICCIYCCGCVSQLHQIVEFAVRVPPNLSLNHFSVQ